MDIICRSKDVEIIDQWTIKVAHIDCTKYTYEVLRSTLALYLNNAINELQQDGRQRVCVYEKNEKGLNGNKMYTCQIDNYE